MRKLASFAAGCGAAILAAVLLLPEGVWLPLGGGFALLALTAALLRGRLPDRARRRALLYCIGAAAGLLWTWGYTQIYIAPVRQLDEHTIRLSAVVTDWSTPTKYGAQVNVRAELPGGGHAAARLYVDEEYSDLRPGDRVRTVARCRLAGRTADGEETTYFTARGILLTAVAYGDMEVDRPARIPLRYLPCVLARALKQGIAAAVAEDAAPLVTAVTTGDRSGLDDGFTAALRRVGLSHMVAVSGMHLAFLVALMELLLGRGRRRTALVCIPVTALFALMTGGTPSVVRAAVMADLLLVAPLVDRERDGITSLSAALILLLIQNPYAAADVGLQLSFAATLGILLFAARLQRYFLCVSGWDAERKSTGGRAIGRLMRILFGSLSTTFGALVFTVPLSALYFGSVSLIAPLANLAALWAVSLVFCFGILGGAAGAVLPALGAVIALPATLLSRYLTWIVPALSRIPFAAVTLESGYCLAWLILLYLILTLALVLPGRKRLWVTAGAAALSLCAALLFTVLTLRAGELTVQVLDVGQGQCVLLRSGGGFILCDCGGDGYPGAGTAAADSLERMGSRTLDLLVLSHYHDDHANGVLTLLDRVHVKQIALPDVEPESDLRRAILARAEALGIKTLFVRERTELSVGRDAVVTVLPPLAEGGDANEQGLTVLCACGEYDVLLTGDMGLSTEKRLIASEPLPDVELMIAGHHGSKYANSDLLLDAVRPDEVVFSVGADNSYGHPAPETLERFERIGARISRTDQMGTVTLQVWPHRRQEVETHGAAA